MNKDRPIFHIHMDGGEQRGIDLVAGSVAFPRQIGLIFDERDYVGVQAKTEVWSTVECTTPDEWHFIAVSYDHTTGNDICMPFI